MREWMDEKQFADMAFGSLTMSYFSMPIIIIFAVLSALEVIGFPTYTWLMLVFLIMVFIHSLVMVIKNQESLIEMDS
ncbi:MAG: hypothetical protein JEZ00_14750 [Anaerolineaceae bacterium]|nr:hypothetical protein [Anaerolineaceae bacterium]